MSNEGAKAPAEAKVATVKTFVKLLDEYPLIGLVNMEHLPAKQLQRMRAALREKEIVLQMTKRRLILQAFKESKKAGLDKLAAHIRGMPALIFTKENPFSLFKFLKKSQSKAPIKGGQRTPDDIIVPAGPTSFAPGPIIGELGAFKIKTGVEDGKVAIKEDSVVAKAGDEVNAKLAGILTRLGIEPMRIGLDLLAVLEEGEILTRDVLDVDEEAYKQQVVTAHNDAFALAMELAVPNEETTTFLLQRAFMDAVTLSLERDILNGETLAPLLGKAYAASLALAGKLPPEALGDDAKAVMEAATSAPPPTDDKKEEGDESKAEKKEEKKPEEAAAGLGALFG